MTGGPVSTPDENRRRIAAAVEAFNRGDLDSYLASYAEDAFVHGLPARFEPSPSGLRAFLAEIRAGLPDLRVTIEDTVAEGNRVAARLTSRGTHRGDLLGARPTGKTVEWDGLTIRRLGPDGRTVERWIRNDTAGLLAQLGLASPS